MTIQILGMGLPRTGTLSLKLALEQLLTIRCYHALEIGETDVAHMQQWAAVADGKPIAWDSLFAGYQAVVDYPAVCFSEQLIAAYPQAKVIVTVRDPDAWYTSMTNTVWHHYLRLRAEALTWQAPLTDQQTCVSLDLVVEEKKLWNGLFGGKFEDKAHMLDMFAAHTAHITRLVPAERLFVFQVAEGWEPLCRFLDVPIPHNQPFPKANDSPSYRASFGLDT